MTNDNQKYIFHVNGMHCKSCVIVTESELMELPFVHSARSNLRTHTVEVQGSFGNQNPDMIADELTKVLVKHGYTLTYEKQENSDHGVAKKGKWDWRFGLVDVRNFLQRRG